MLGFLYWIFVLEFNMSCINFLKFLFCLWKDDLMGDDMIFNWCLIVLDVILLGMGFMFGLGLYVVIG